LRFLDHPLARDDLLTDVLAVLAVRPKSIPPKYFYNEPGSRLFDAICEQPEYALTRTDGVPACPISRPLSATSTSLSSRARAIAARRAGRLRRAAICLAPGASFS
jgi:uncharacterized SAM-dependent methyltransferase